MKITPKPLTVEDQFDKSRDIAGLNKWAQSSRTIGFIMFILGWFTIPAEVFLRRDFGQRWFTIVNFYAGLFLLLIFATLQYIVAALWGGVQEFLYRMESALNPFHDQHDTPNADGVMDSSMVFILLLYIVMGSYHLFKIWWRSRTNTALHSFDDGTSRTERMAGVLMRLVNVLAMPFVWLYVRLLPRNQRLIQEDEESPRRKHKATIPKLIHDRTAFANTVFEPLLLLVLAFWFNGIASLWLLASAIAVAIHANWKETARLNKILDFRDSVIEAKVMMYIKDGAEQPNAPTLIMHQMAETIKENPKVAPQMTEQYPDLMSIIEEMNRDKSHLAN